MTRSTDSTPELLARFRRGDQSGYQVLFERYRGPLLRFIRCHCDERLRRVVPAEDILQETHLSALGTLQRFTYRRELSFYFWLCAIARSRIVDHCRRLGRRPPPASLSDIDPPARTTSDHILRALGEGRDPQRRLLLLESLHVIAASLEGLTERRRQALLLRYFDDLDGGSAAAVMGVSPGAYRMLVSRGLLQLRRRVTELLGEPATT